MEMTWADKIEAQAMARGIEKGQKRGREEGLQEGMQALILDLLKHRFGSVPKDLARRIRTITDRDRLGRLAEQLLDAASLEELKV